MKARYEMKKAACVGAVCIATYAVGYFFRSILSVYTPQMLASTLFTKEGIALLSSVYMISYAAGQLVNGVLGDYIKSKYMVLMGMAAAGGCCLPSSARASCRPCAFFWWASDFPCCGGRWSRSFRKTACPDTRASAAACCPCPRPWAR